MHGNEPMNLKILLINPPRVRGLSVVREDRYEHRDVGAVYPPLSLLQAAAVLRRDGHDVRVLDANGFNLRLEDVGQELSSFAPHLVVTRLAFDSQEEDYRVLQLARAAVPSAVTAVRNKILSDVPELADRVALLPDVDLFVIGELDAVLPAVAQTLSDAWGLKTAPSWGEIAPALRMCPGLKMRDGQGGVITTGTAALMNLEKVPFPAYDLLPSLKPYHTGVFDDHFAMIQTSRGCPFNCSFCAYASEKFRPRDPRHVAEELKWLKTDLGVKGVLFFDDVLALNSERTRGLAGTLVREGVGMEWVACTRANLVDTPTLKEMKAAGCKELAVGIESGSPEILKTVNKGVTLDDIRRCRASCREAEVLFYGMCIIGLPGETEGTLKETLDFILEIDPFYTQFCFSTPFPNTDMYQWYDERGFLLTKDFSKYSPLDPTPVVRTEALSAEDLIRLRRQIYKKLLMRPRYLLSKIKWTDPAWTFRNACKMGGRILNTVTGRAIR